jgi:PDZ domain-containing protein
MSRRVRTLVVAGVAFVVLFALALTLPVPYVILSPGPTINTLGTEQGQQIIVINGRQPNHTTGNLNLTTVNVSTQRLSVFAALDGWLLRDEVVVPRSSIYPPGQSQQQVDAQNSQDFAASQDNAIAAAFCELGYKPKFGVILVEANTPAQKKLQPADVLVKVDGTAVSTADQLTALLAKESPGKQVQVDVTRAGKPVSVTITLAAPISGRTGARIGIEVGQVCAAPFSVDLGLGNEIGGPSAGLMFALGIMDKVGPIDLTKGMFIAGTGTIDPNGKVGPIGGIALKMIAARQKGATIFLAPAGNCSDVKGTIPKGLDVVKVATLHEAAQDHVALQANKPVPHC